MPSPIETITKSLKETRQMELLESGLSRINHHLNDGKDLAIISSVKDADTPHSKHVQMINSIRKLGYGPIESTGRTKNWTPERSVVVPGMTREHAKQIGKQFDQNAIVHYEGKHKTAYQHWLKDTDTHKEGEVETLGAAHFNNPKTPAMTVLKGAGYNPKKDTESKNVTRQFSFSKENINSGDEFILESLMRPPRTYCPDRTYYLLEE